MASFLLFGAVSFYCLFLVSLNTSLHCVFCLSFMFFYIHFRSFFHYSTVFLLFFAHLDDSEQRIDDSKHKIYKIPRPLHTNKDAEYSYNINTCLCLL